MNPNFYVVCDEVSEGLRPSEVTVAVRSLKGRREFLRVSKTSLLSHGGQNYLCVGVVHQDPGTRAFLIEFPHEADSGANRIWVPEVSIYVERAVGIPA
jgi:hypothetical protein